MKMNPEVDADYLNYKKMMMKEKRHRESNWERSEKKTLLRLIQQYRFVIDNRGNDATWLRKKTAAWESIQRGMIASGSRRSLKSIRQQYTRMKGEAKRRGMKIIKKEKIDTEIEDLDDDVSIIPDKCENPIDCVVKEEYLHEETPPNIDAIIEKTDNQDNIGDNMMLSIDSILSSIPSPSYQQQTDSSIVDTSILNSQFDNNSINVSVTEPVLPPFPRPIPARKYVKTFRPPPPRNGLTRDILDARLKQIEQETAHKAELHLLDVAQKKEVHALEVQKLRDQIAQQRDLSQAQLEKLKNSA